MDTRQGDPDEDILSKKKETTGHRQKNQGRGWRRGAGGWGVGHDQLWPGLLWLGFFETEEAGGGLKGWGPPGLGPQGVGDPKGAQTQKQGAGANCGGSNGWGPTPRKGGGPKGA